ncbi:MAG TPA: farnesyl diphosphate synthase [bacterium]|nr:farnesyl diphosphate synthase [bacterium]
MPHAQSGPLPVLSPEARSAVEARLAADRRAIEGALGQFLRADGRSEERLQEAMRHSVFAGGKRLRPILVLAGAEVSGMPAEAVLPAACAVEMVHTYSLVHDDLPAMDNSPTRRGLPTCHVLYGDAVAILAGDALHALAFEVLARNAEVADVPADRVVRAIAELATGIGIRGMVGGQMRDLLAAGQPLAGADVQEIHRLKTGALIRASVRIGGILGGASPDALDALTRYGTHVGLAFQIVDDILDVVGEEAKLGKGTGSDAAQAKITFPSVFGLAASQQLAQDATTQAMRALEPLGPRARWLRDLSIHLLARDR